MNLLRFTTIGILFAFLGSANQFLAAEEPSSAAAQAALRKQGFPWYDAKTDGFRPMNPVKRTEPEPRNPPSGETGSTGDTSYGGDASLLRSLQMVVMWGLLIAVVVTVAVIALRTMQDSLLDNPEREAVATVSLEALEALPEPVRKVHDLLGEATRLASTSDFEAAMIFYYSWQLVQLDRQQIIELQKGKTNRRYQREVAASASELLDLFSPSMRLFEDTFFGHLPVSRDQFMQVWEQQHRLQFKQGSRRS